MEQHRLYNVKEVEDLRQRISDILSFVMNTKRVPRGEETGWLIEWPGGPDGSPTWWHPGSGWTKDASRATRFARKEDAEGYIENTRFVGGVIATEHKWMDLPVAAAS